MQTELGKDRSFQAALGTVWPAESAVGIVRGLYGRTALLGAASSARVTGRESRLIAAPDGQLTGAAAIVAAELLAYGSVALVTPPELSEELQAELARRAIPLVPYDHASLPGHVALILPEVAKGLEFDAVVVVEPAAIASVPGGTGLLYIALTRAVQELAVVHSGVLPEVLAPLAA